MERQGMTILCVLLYLFGENKPVSGSLCSRFPAASICRNKRQDDDTARSYCAKWVKHYGFYCVGPGSGDSRASEFCPYYKTTCNAEAKDKAAPAPSSFSRVQANKFLSPQSAQSANPGQPVPAPAPAPAQQSNPLLPSWPAPLPQPQVQPVPAPGPTGFNSGGGLSSIGQPLAFLGGPSALNAGTPLGIPGGANSPLSIGQGFGVGPFARAYSATNINPLSSVGTGTSVNAAGLPISSYRGVNFGGLIPGGLGNIFGRRK